MKVTTLNLAGYKNWAEREAKIVSYLDNESPEILFLQEVKYDTNYSSYSQSKYLNLQLASPYPYSQASVSRFYQPSDGSSFYREGLAVLSRYPIVDSEVIVLTKRPDDTHTRIIQKVNILVNDRMITFTNVHFSNNEYSVEQLGETIQIIKNANEKSIILGDFNIFDIQAVSHLYASDYVASTEITKYISFPSESVTLDYALVPRDYRLTSLKIGENLSDHNAVSFELEA